MMEEQTSPVARRLAAAIAALLAGAGATWIANYRSGLSPAERLPYLLPRNAWGVYLIHFTGCSRTNTVIEDRARLGFFELRLSRRTYPR